MYRDMLYDLHGHFLPGMDDGSPSAEKSLKMLAMSREQGVGRMIATPHYYPVESVSAFLDRRQKAHETLQAAIKASGEDYPAYCLGAEVAYRPGLGYAEDLEGLCIGNSRYLLLEMPFAPWGREVLRDVRNMSGSQGVIPIIAHIERYYAMQKEETLRGLLEQDVLVQMNVGNLLDWRTRSKGKKWLKNGMVQLLGSDCHDTVRRPPNMGQAAILLKKWHMEEILREISYLGQEIFQEAEN